MKYFKSSAPDQPLYLSNGAQLKWDRVDQYTGIYPPSGKGISEWLSGELQAAARAGRGGVEEINHAEYLVLVEKKNKQPWTPSWREELSKDTMAQAALAKLSGLPGGAGVALADIKPVTPTTPLPPGATPDRPNAIAPPKPK